MFLLAVCVNFYHLVYEDYLFSLIIIKKNEIKELVYFISFYFDKKLRGI